MAIDKHNIWLKSILGDTAKEFIAKILFFSRNKYILFNIFNRAKANRVNLNYWSEAENLGDLLSPIVVNYLLGKRGLTSEVQVSQTRHFYAVGSILTAGQQDATVWGSGILNCKILYRLKNRKLDIRSVRGPLTRLILMEYGYQVPEIYGDPAIIMPDIYRPLNRRKKYKYGLVLHKDYKLKYDNSEDTILLDIKTSDYRSFIDRLAEVETVISSSLHGIILAEVYGVHAVLLKPQVDLFKYYDYYYGTNRLSFPMANSVEEAKTTNPPFLPDFDILKERLIEAFPYDIYSIGE